MEKMLRREIKSLSSLSHVRLAASDVMSKSLLDSIDKHREVFRLDRMRNPDRTPLYATHDWKSRRFLSKISRRWLSATNPNANRIRIAHGSEPSRISKPLPPRRQTRKYSLQIAGRKNYLLTGGFWLRQSSEPREDPLRLSTLYGPENGQWQISSVTEIRRLVSIRHDGQDSMRRRFQ